MVSLRSFFLLLCSFLYFTSALCLSLNAIALSMQITNIIVSFPKWGLQVKVVLRADVSGGTYDKVAVISGLFESLQLKSFQCKNENEILKCV